MNFITPNDYHDIFAIDETSRSGLVWKDVPVRMFSCPEWSMRGWKTRFVGTPVGELNVHGYCVYRNRNHGQNFRLHRVVYEMVHGCIPDGMEIDHIDMNRGNNRVSNLRLATDTQNKLNRAAQKGKIVPLKGVSKNRNGWRARVTVGRVVVFYKTFPTPEEAHAAYCAAAAPYHGEFFRNA